MSDNYLVMVGDKYIMDEDEHGIYLTSEVSLSKRFSKSEASEKSSIINLKQAEEVSKVVVI